MIRAFLYLQTRSVLNRLRARLRRLRQPKYLAGGVVGLLYFYGFFFRNLLQARGKGPGADAWAPPPGDGSGLLELVGAWALLGMLAAFWVIPSRRAALEFSEAEIQFLFPAPVSRRTLIHYKLLNWQLGLLFTSLVVTFFSGRLFRLEGAWMAVLGWWLVLLFIQLHALGASFARSLLLARGLASWPRRVAVGVLVLVAVGAVGAWAREGIPPFPEEFDPQEIRAWLEAVSAPPLVAWILRPLRWIVGLAFSRDPAAFATAVLPVAILVGLHYLWILHANVAFEEAAVEAARRTAERQASLGAGQRPTPIRRGNRRVPFPLQPSGPPWLALGWKNLIAAGSFYRGSGLVVLASILVPIVVVAGAAGHGRTWPAVVGGMALMLLALSVFVGPGTLRVDLRQDLVSSGDVLKALPLPGWQVVLGELFAPWVILTGFQAFLVVLAFALLPVESRLVGPNWATRCIAAGAVGVLVPGLSLAGLCLQNAAALLFPAWILALPGQPRGGVESMGQHAIVFAAQFVAFLIAVLPVGLAAAATFALLAWALGPWGALLPAALVGAATLFAEAGCAVLLLGRLWERLDVSRELGT